MPEMTTEMLAVTVGRMIEDAREYRESELSGTRQDANDYYNGVMDDMQAEDNRSSIVSKDVRATIKKVKPSIHRVLLRNDTIVEYQPVAEGDENDAEQATDYINNITLKECNGRRAIKSAIHDACLHRNGILKWWCEERQQTQITRHSGLLDVEFAQLVAPDEITVMEHSQREEEVQDPTTGFPMQGQVNDAKIKRTIKDKRIKLEAKELEHFLIDSEACNIEDAILVGEDTEECRSDLIALGFDKDAIMALPDSGSKADEQEEEERTRRDNAGEQDNDHLPKELRKVDYYEVYVRIDFDGDGIAELRRIIMIGGFKAKNVFENEEWDEAPYADIEIEERPHQWEGYSIFDDAEDIQKVKTVLLRETLDNIYWQNSKQPIVQEGAIQNPESVTNPRFGEPIKTRQGVDVRTALGYNEVPFVAGTTFAMQEYMDGVLTDRTGISDASSGLAPDALQNMTAKATALIEQGGIGQTEDMVATVATGLERAFKGLLKLVVQHQDKPRTVRLRGEWVTFDPKSWDVGMDVSVNVGLGAGTRERDMLAMNYVTGMQEKLLAAFGADNPFVSPDNLYNSIAKSVEAAGLKSVDLYFTKPDEQEIARRLAEQNAQPNPEVAKVQAEAQLEQQKMQNALRIEEAKIIAQRDKERAQMEADLEVKRIELANEALLNEQKIQLERDKIAAQMDMKAMDVAQKDADSIRDAASDIQVAEIEAEADVTSAAISAEGMPN